MSSFLQLHLLTCYPPANLNRDDLGRPKTGTVGGVERLRISSQSLKRAWRTSGLFREQLADQCGVRTKRMGVMMLRALTEGRTLLEQMRIEEAGEETPAAAQLTPVATETAVQIVRTVAGVFGKLAGQPDDDGDDAAENAVENAAESTASNEGEEGAAEAAEETTAPTPESPNDETRIVEKDFELKQLAHFSREEIRGISELLEEVRNGGEVPTGQDELKRRLLRRGNSAADIAMFGRFLADKREFTVEAAVQVAHAFGVQRATITDDWFTAVDDLARRDASGAAHMDVNEFDSGLFYLYVCVDRDLLVKNLGHNEDLARRAVRALIACATQVAPVGKQASFASRAYASYILAEKGDYQPRSLAVAFLDPIGGPGVLERAITALTTTRQRMDRAYGQRWEAEEVSTLAGNGTLTQLQDFVMPPSGRTVTQ